MFGRISTAILLLTLPLTAKAQDRFHGNVSGSVYFPIAFGVVNDIDADQTKASFGWPELDGNLTLDLLYANKRGRSFLSLYAGGTYRSMFGLQEVSDGRDFEGAMSIRQARIGAKFFDLVRVSYVMAGIKGSGTSNGLLTTYTYGGSTTWTNGYEIGIETSENGNAVGLYYQSSLAAPTGEYQTAVEWSTIEGRVRSTIFEGRDADGYVQLTVGYDQFKYDDRNKSNRLPMDMNALRIGVGIGVAF